MPPRPGLPWSAPPWLPITGTMKARRPFSFSTVTTVRMIPPLPDAIDAAAAGTDRDALALTASVWTSDGS